MPRNRRVLTLVVLTLCVSLVAVGGLAPLDVAAQDEDTNETETDAPHAHPDETSAEGDSERVANWLQQRLSGSLGDSTVHLNEGQYDQAREALGDDYDGHLAQYAEVSSEEEAEQFEEAQGNQTALIDGVEEYDETYEEYEEARAAGDDERARELARDLDSLSETVDEEGEAVQERQRTIEEETGADTSETRDSIEETRSTVETTQQEVRDTEFITTELTVETDSTEASFDDPMLIDGTITTSDGGPVAYEEITLEIGQQTVQTTTDASGSFSVEYTPTVESLELTELEISYSPETQSEYGGAETTVPVSIEQTEPTIEITETTESVAFGDEFSVSGSVEAGGVGIEGVPVAIFADGERLDEVETDEDGRFEQTTDLPASVQAGDVEVRALVTLDNQALTSADTTTLTTVSETPSEIAVATEHTDDSIYVQGSLATAEGTPVGGESITLEFAGQSTTVETAADGSYETLIGVPDTAGAFVTVEAIYAESESNIGDSSASADVQVGEATLLTQLSESLGIEWLDVSLPPLPLQHWLAIAGFLVLLLTGVYLLFDRKDSSAAHSDTGPGGRSDDAGGTSSQDSTTLRATLLASARELAQAGDSNRAVERAYIAVRQDESGEGRADTHWEFYRNRQESGFAAEQIDALRSLTQRFEQAAFSAFGVSSDDADAAVDEAETIIDE